MLNLGFRYAIIFMRFGSVEHKPNMKPKVAISVIAKLLNVNWSTVKSVLTKFVQYGAIAARPRPGRPHQLSEANRTMICSKEMLDR